MIDSFYLTGWIGVDLDGTLARHEGGSKIGAPIEPMMARVREWVADGVDVRIMTARACNKAGREERIAEVQDWLEVQGLPRLTVTSEKDFRMLLLWDDRAVTVECNTGRVLTVGVA